MIGAPPVQAQGEPLHLGSGQNSRKHCSGFDRTPGAMTNSEKGKINMFFSKKSPGKSRQRTQNSTGSNVYSPMESSIDQEAIISNLRAVTAVKAEQPTYGRNGAPPRRSRFESY
jgi:hypothetical protein